MPFPQFARLAPELKDLIWSKAVKVQEYTYTILEQRNGTEIDKTPSLRIIGTVHTPVSQVDRAAQTAVHSHLRPLRYTSPNDHVQRTFHINYDTSIIYLGFLFDEPEVLNSDNNEFSMQQREPAWYSISKGSLKNVKHAIVAWHSVAIMYNIHKLALDMPNLETIVFDKTYYNCVDPFGETWEWGAYCNVDDLKRTPARRERYVRAVFDQTPADDVDRECAWEVALENDVNNEWENPPAVRIITMDRGFWWH